MKIVSRSEFCEDKKAPEKMEVKVGQVYRYSSYAYYLIIAEKNRDAWYVANLTTPSSGRDLYILKSDLRDRKYTLVEATLVVEEDSK